MWNSEDGKPFPSPSGSGLGWAQSILNSAQVCSVSKEEEQNVKSFDVKYATKKNPKQTIKGRNQEKTTEKKKNSLCSSSRSSSSCLMHRKAGLSVWHDRWCRWNTPRETPAPWQYSHCHLPEHYPHTEHIDLREKDGERERSMTLAVHIK